MAVRTHHELEVAATEYEPEVAVMGREALRHGALRPLGVRVAVRGRLHLCLANVGKSPWLAWPKALGAGTGDMRHVPLAGYLQCQLEPLSWWQPLGSGDRWPVGRAVRLLVVLVVPAWLRAPAWGGGEAGGAGARPCGWVSANSTGPREKGAGLCPNKLCCKDVTLPGPAGCFYFVYLIPCPVNVQ